MQQRVARAHHVGVAHRTSEDAAQDVAAALIRRQHAIGDQEGACAQMVRDHAVGGAEGAVRVLARGLGGSNDEGAQRVRVVVVVLALQDGGEAFQAHPRVDGGAGQRVPRPGRLLEVLHEDQIPDLDEAVAVLVRRTGRAAGDRVAVVVEDFRARATGAGIAHAPKVVRRRDADNAAVGDAGDVAPELGGVLILGEDGDQQLVLGQAEVARQQGPGVLDRLWLEVVAEGEIAQHLEEGVVARGVAHIVEVIVLAARADAFLRRRRGGIGALFLAGEDVLELHHAGIREHQRRVVARHQRG